MNKLNSFRPWFYAATVYNAVIGLVVVVFPGLVFERLGMVHANYPSLAQCIGMMIGVYAIGYWLIARDPVRFGPLVYVALLGKILGPIGLLVAASRGELPWSFGWVNLFNDLIWLPAFGLFAARVWRIERSHRK